jgi:hypothetical protein
MRTISLFMLAACGTKEASSPSDTADGGAGGADCEERAYDLPSTRGEVNGVWDAARGRFVIFGGDEGMPQNCIPKPEYLSETWAFHPDCNNFSQIATSGMVPHARIRHASALDAARGQMLVYGGRHREAASGNYDLFTDVWALDLETDTWSELPSDDGPRPRVTHTMVVSGDQLLVYGGNSTSSSTSYLPVGDLWSYDLVDQSWTELDDDTDAGERLFHAATVSDDGGTMYVYGGADENALFGPFFTDLWAYDVGSQTWTELSDGTEAAPLGRIMPSLLFDGARNRLLMWAGHDDGNLGNTNEVWAFELSDNSWSKLESGDSYQNPAYGFCDFPADFVDVDIEAPERRYFGAATLSEDELLIFGGKTDCGQSNDAWGWDLDQETWTERSGATFGEVCLRASAGDCESLCY